MGVITKNEIPFLSLFFTLLKNFKNSIKWGVYLGRVPPKV